MSFVRVGLLSLSLVSSACGANVVFGEDGGEGGNGADGTGANNTGAGNQGGSTGTFNTTVSNPDTTAGPRDACQVLCAQHPQCGEGDCYEGCRQLYFTGCEAEADALIWCATENIGPDCELNEGACSRESFSFQECAGGDEECFTDRCAEAPGGCQCFGSCFGSQIEQSCAFDNNGQARCQCFVDGDFWGECEDDGFSCSIEEGCCREFFFEG